jgi:osmotically-inducible protein OsmY
MTAKTIFRATAAGHDRHCLKADTKDNVIKLTGHVRTWAEHDAVLGAALMARGVIDVRDNLQVTG